MWLCPPTLLTQQQRREDQQLQLKSKNFAMHETSHSNLNGRDVSVLEPGTLHVTLALYCPLYVFAISNANISSCGYLPWIRSPGQGL